MKSQRITVSGRNLEFLVQLSQDMDEIDLKEVLSYLLRDVRLLGYKVGDKVAPEPQRQLQQPIINYGFDASTFERIAPIPECDCNYQEQDPIIARLSSLIEEF